jgi:hypothetical protein
MISKMEFKFYTSRGTEKFVKLLFKQIQENIQFTLYKYMI